MIESESLPFQVGQKGKFTILDALGQPTGIIDGRILYVLNGKTCLYALMETEKGTLSVRLR